MSSDEIELTEKIIPDAYHGTSGEAAELIQRDGFRQGSHEASYLGDGVYFYESARSLAEEWARNRFPGREIVVLRAIINLARCLDMHIPEHVRLVEKYAQKLKTEVARRSRGPSKPRDITDSFVINFIAFHLKIDTVRAGRTPLTRAKQGGRIFPGSRWGNRQEIMICVRNPVCILDVSKA